MIQFISYKIVMNTVFEKIYLSGIIPVVSIECAADAVSLAKAMLKGGLSVIEITYRTMAAAEAMKAVSLNCPEMIVGAGTVLTKEQAELARKMGAEYVVSPGYDEELADFCKNICMPFIPGVANATDIQKGIKAGLSVFKFFPSEPLGGLKTINYLSAPFSRIKFVPAGGIDFDNIAEYLSNDHVFACAGGFVARERLIREGQWDKVTELCKKAIKTSLDFRIAHVGIHFSCGEDAQKASDWFRGVFDFDIVTGDSSIFAASDIELMKTRYLNKNRHIALYASSVERAHAWLERKGQKIIADSIRYDSRGRMLSFYLENEIEGFAVHIVRK